MSGNTPPTKPLLRGYFHQEAFFTALGACTLLIAKGTSSRSIVASITYSAGLLLLLGISALYHRPQWRPGARALMKRLDHSAIFILIAGTFTPVCLLALPETQGLRLLVIAWSAAGIGILQSVLWVKVPKWFSALLYVCVGALALPYLTDLRSSLGNGGVLLLGAGGLAYLLGAILYAIKRPRLAPTVFGYHELFHILTIVGAIFHFVVVYQLIR